MVYLMCLLLDANGRPVSSASAERGRRRGRMILTYVRGSWRTGAQLLVVVAV